MTGKIPLTQGKFALVDDDVYEWASKHKWYAHRNGNKWYARRRGKPPDMKTIRLHNEIMKAGSVDHINGDGLDCRRENMRLATKSENSRNRGPNANNTCGYKGVYIDKGSGKWRARIRASDKRLHLGYFATPEAAARAYDEAARKHHGEFAKTNFL